MRIFMIAPLGRKVLTQIDLAQEALQKNTASA
jgi:hypothetical protein